MEAYFDYYTVRTDFLDEIFNQIYTQNCTFPKAVRHAYNESLTHLPPNSIITATQGEQHTTPFVTKTEVLDALEQDAREAWSKYPTGKARIVNDALQSLLNSKYDGPGELLAKVEPREYKDEYVPIPPEQLDITPRQLSRNGVKLSPFKDTLSVDLIHSWLADEHPEHVD